MDEEGPHAYFLVRRNKRVVEEQMQQEVLVACASI